MKESMRQVFTCRFLYRKYRSLYNKSFRQDAGDGNLLQVEKELYRNRDIIAKKILNKLEIMLELTMCGYAHEWSVGIQFGGIDTNEQYLSRRNLKWQKNGSTCSVKAT